MHKCIARVIGVICAFACMCDKWQGQLMSISSSAAHCVAQPQDWCRSCGSCGFIWHITCAGLCKAVWVSLCGSIALLRSVACVFSLSLTNCLDSSVASNHKHKETHQIPGACVCVCVCVRARARM